MFLYLEILLLNMFEYIYRIYFFLSMFIFRNTFCKICFKRFISLRYILYLEMFLFKYVWIYFKICFF